MSTNKNSVGVVIPTYNGESYITEALASLENQTLAPDEVVVVDDGSTDRTCTRVLGYKAVSKLTIKYRRQPNQGIATARNCGVAACETRYIAFLDSDDTFYPEFLERMRSALINHPHLALCFADRDVVDAFGGFMRRDLDVAKFRAMPVSRLGPAVSQLQGNPFLTLVNGNVLPIGCLMLRKQTFDDLNGFDPSMRIVEDRLFLLNASKKGTFGFVDQPLGIKRRHANNVSASGNAFNMAWYAHRALTKIAQQASQPRLASDERAAVRAARKQNAGPLLYTAARQPALTYPKVVIALVSCGSVRIRPLAKSSLRYCWLSLKSGFARLHAGFSPATSHRI